MLLGLEKLATLLESGLKQPSLGEGRVIFLGVLDRLDPNPYLTQDNSLCT